MGWVDVENRKVKVNVGDEGWKEWEFELSEIEEQLTVNRGLTEAFGVFGYTK